MRKFTLFICFLLATLGIVGQAQTVNTDVGNGTYTMVFNARTEGTVDNNKTTWTSTVTDTNPVQVTITSNESTGAVDVYSSVPNQSGAKWGMKHGNYTISVPEGNTLVSVAVTASNCYNTESSATVGFNGITDEGTVYTLPTSSAEPLRMTAIANEDGNVIMNVTKTASTYICVMKYEVTINVTLDQQKAISAAEVSELPDIYFNESDKQTAITAINAASSIEDIRTALTELQEKVLPLTGRFLTFQSHRAASNLLNLDERERSYVGAEGDITTVWTFKTKDNGDLVLYNPINKLYIGGSAPGTSQQFNTCANIDDALAVVVEPYSDANYFGLRYDAITTQHKYLHDGATNRVVAWEYSEPSSWQIIEKTPQEAMEMLSTYASTLSNYSQYTTDNLRMFTEDSKSKLSAIINGTVNTSASTFEEALAAIEEFGFNLIPKENAWVYFTQDWNSNAIMKYEGSQMKHGTSADATATDENLFQIVNVNGNTFNLRASDGKFVGNLPSANETIVPLVDADAENSSKGTYGLYLFPTKTRGVGIFDANIDGDKRYFHASNNRIVRWNTPDNSPNSAWTLNGWLGVPEEFSMTVTASDISFFKGTAAKQIPATCTYAPTDESIFTFNADNINVIITNESGEEIEGATFSNGNIVLPTDLAVGTYTAHFKYANGLPYIDAEESVSFSVVEPETLNAAKENEGKLIDALNAAGLLNLTETLTVESLKSTINGVSYSETVTEDNADNATAALATVHAQIVAAINPNAMISLSNSERNMTWVSTGNKVIAKPSEQCNIYTAWQIVPQSDATIYLRNVMNQGTDTYYLGQALAGLQPEGGTRVQKLVLGYATVEGNSGLTFRKPGDQYMTWTDNNDNQCGGSNDIAERTIWTPAKVALPEAITISADKTTIATTDEGDARVVTLSAVVTEPTENVPSWLRGVTFTVTKDGETVELTNGNSFTAELPDAGSADAIYTVTAVANAVATIEIAPVSVTASAPGKPVYTASFKQGEQTVTETVTATVAADGEDIVITVALTDEDDATVADVQPSIVVTDADGNEVSGVVSGMTVTISTATAGSYTITVAAPENAPYTLTTTTLAISVTAEEADEPEFTVGAITVDGEAVSVGEDKILNLEAANANRTIDIAIEKNTFTTELSHEGIIFADGKMTITIAGNNTEATETTYTVKNGEDTLWTLIVKVAAPAATEPVEATVEPVVEEGIASGYDPEVDENEPEILFQTEPVADDEHAEEAHAHLVILTKAEMTTIPVANATIPEGKSGEWSFKSTNDKVATAEVNADGKVVIKHNGVVGTTVIRVFFKETTTEESVTPTVSTSARLLADDGEIETEVTEEETPDALFTLHVEVKMAGDATPTLTADGRTSIEIQTGKTATLQTIKTANNAVIWTSSNENVATVDENGVVTAVSAGTATITATLDGFPEQTVTFTVRVTVPTGPIGSGIEAINADAAEGRAAIYDLQGRRLERISSAGFYIVNGVKTLVR